MESFGGIWLGDTGRSVTKRRSNTSRRPRDINFISDIGGISLFPSTSPSHGLSEVSNHKLVCGSYHMSLQDKNELNLYNCSLRASFSNLVQTDNCQEVIRNKEGGYEESGEAGTTSAFEDINKKKHNKKSALGVLDSSDWKGKDGYNSRMRHGSSQGVKSGLLSSGFENGNRFKKVKLKVGGVTRTIDANSTHKEKTGEDVHVVQNKGSGLHLGPSKGLSKVGSSIGKADHSQLPRKSKHTRKRKVFDNEDDGDDEEAGSKKHRKISKVLERSEYNQYNSNVRDHSHLRSGKDDHVLERNMASAGEFEVRKKKPRKIIVDSSLDSKNKLVVTTRQRALQKSKDECFSSCASLVGLSNELPPAPLRKQKEKFSEVEQQLKKAEASQRRKMQMEKAARESEAEAIRKILGQDSSRKKQENKVKKRQEELAQAKAANSMILQANLVRWVTSPTGTVVTFAEEMGLPSIFDPKHCSYPPPREKCAVPSCANPYKYRDSKSKLPLCSLQCYKAMHEKMQPVSAC